MQWFTKSRAVNHLLHTSKFSMIIVEKKTTITEKEMTKKILLPLGACLLFIATINPIQPPIPTGPPAVKQTAPVAQPVIAPQPLVQPVVPPPPPAMPAPETKPPRPPFRGIQVKNNRKEIVMGTTAPLSGSLYKLGNDLTKGAGIVFNEINRNNRVHDHFIKYIIRDDEYEQAGIKKNLKTIFKDTSILMGTFSSDSLYAIPDNQFNDLLVLFPDAGASKFRNPKYHSLFFYRPSTKQEVEALICYAVNVLFKRKLAIFYEDSYWGIDGMKAAKASIDALGKEKAECVAVGSYVRNTVDVHEAIEKIADKSPEAVICISHYRPTYSFIKHMLNKGRQKTRFLGTSETALIQNYLKKSRGVDLISSAIVPNPWRSKLPIAKNYRAAMKRYLPNLKLSTTSFEGYINANLFIKTLERVTPPITKEKIVQSLEGLKDFDLDGIKLTFDKKTRSLSKSVWMNETRYADWKIFNRKEMANGHLENCAD